MNMQPDMIDFLGLYTRNLNLINLEFLKTNSKNVAEKTIKGLTHHTGYVDNMYWMVTDHGLFVYGSPARFTYGHNFKTLKYADLDKFLDKLSDALSCDVRQMNLSKIDITDNLEMDHPPVVYKRYLGNCQYLPRVGDYQDNGLCYKNGNREAVFYDKVLEAMNKRMVIPAGYAGRNLLRFEYRLLDNVNNYLNGTVITRITDLLDKSTYRALIDAWEQMFNKIELVDVDALRHQPYNRQLSYDQHLTACGIMSNGGLTVVLGDLQDEHQMGNITRRQFHYKKKNLTQAMDAYRAANNIPSPLKDELTRKVREKATENRALLN